MLLEVIDELLEKVEKMSERITQLENRQVVIIDEFSMMKADMLYQLDMRLREVKQQPSLLFGGVSVFLFGDILQLKPVKGRYIFEEPISFHKKCRYRFGSLFMYVYFFFEI